MSDSERDFSTNFPAAERKRFKGKVNWIPLLVKQSGVSTYSQWPNYLPSPSRLTVKELLFLFLYPYKDRRKTQNLLVLGMQARLNGSVCFVTESCHHYHHHHIHQHGHNHYYRTVSAVVAKQSSAKLKQGT